MRIFSLLLLAIFFSACVKDKPQEPIKTYATINSDNSVLIINEGNYGWNNASISIYDANTNNFVQDYYKQQNNNQSLGDVCQSIKSFNNKYYVIVNNSSKIEVLNKSNFTKSATIFGFTSPRYILPISYSKAYVTEYYANNIKVIDLNTNSITGNIPCNGWGDQMAVIYNKAFITNPKSNYCYIINTTNDLITDSIIVGKGASSIIIDKNSKVWVLSSGNSSSNQNGMLSRINPINLQIETSLTFSTGDSPNNLCDNKTHDTLYFLNKNNIYQFPISASALPGNALINGGSKLFYGLGVSPKDYKIYVSDAIDYVQRSKIETYDTQGNFKNSFIAGVISNGFVFE